MPVIRYRTGDRVKLHSHLCECGRSFRLLDGGVIGRYDNAFIIRGVSVFPSAIEDFVRRFPEVGEFAVDVYRRGELDEMELRVELNGAEPDTVAAAIAKEIRNALSLRAQVKPVPYGTLPRSDLTTKRFTDHR
jgi:phenylacetate-CoA ligase